MLLCLVYSDWVYDGHKIVARARAQLGQSQKAETAELMHNTQGSHQEQRLQLFIGGLCFVRWYIYWFWLCFECDFLARRIHQHVNLWTWRRHHNLRSLWIFSSRHPASKVPQIQMDVDWQRRSHDYPHVMRHGGLQIWR